MARGMGYKIGFEGETEFMNAVKQMNAQLRTLQTEMQAVTSAFDREDQSQEKLIAQNRVLTRQIALQEQRVEAQRRLLDEARAAYDESSVVVQRYAQQMNRAVADLNNMNRALRQNETALEQAGNSAEEAGDGLDNLDSEMEGGSRRADLFASVLSGNLAAKGLEVVASAAAGATKKIAEFSAEAEKSLSMMRAQLGLTEEEAESYNGIVTAVYADGIAESMEEAAEAVAKVGQQLGELPAEEMQNVANHALIAQKVFDIDMQESLRGTDAMMKQFGIDADTAYDLIVAGAQRGLNQNGDLADQIAEYSVYYADAGFSAQQMFSMMASGAEKGVFQIDYLNDAIKEFGIRTKDNSDSSKEAFQALGLDAGQMFEMFASGGEQAHAAAQMVNDALFAMDDKVKQNEIGVSLYGTKWEDVGIGAVQAMASVQNEFGSVDGAAQAAGEAMVSNFSDQMRILQQEVAAAVFEMTNGTLEPEQFREKMTEIITRLSDAVTENAPMLLEKGFELAEGFGGALADAAPELVPDAVSLIVAIAETLMEHIPDIMMVAPEIVGGLVSGLISAIPDLILAVPQLIVALVTAFDDTIDNFDEVGREIVLGIWNGIKESWNKLKNGFKNLVGSLLGTAEKELDINSPSGEFRDRVGKQITAGIAEGIAKNKDKAEKALADVSKDLLKAAETWVGDKKDLGEMTLRQETAFWEDLKSMEGFQADEIAKIDRKITESKKNVLLEEKKLMEEHEKSIQSRTDALQRFAGLFDKINSEEVSGKDLLANLEGQVNAFKEWQENMEELREKGVAGELLEELRQLGPGSADEVAALNKLTEAELDRYIQLFREKGQLAKQQAKKEIGPLLIAEAAQDAVKQMERDLQAEAEQIGGSILEVVSSAVTSANEDTQEQNFQTITAGMAAQEPILAGYIEELKDRLIALIEGFRNDYTDVGRMMMEGVAQGIRDGRSGVVDAVAAVIAAAVKRAKSDLDINSPSKVFAEIGGYMASGLDVGWTEKMRDVNRSISGSLASISSPPRTVESVGATGGRNYSYGDINLYIDTVNNGGDRDVYRMAQELEFFRRQQSAARGG